MSVEFDVGSRRQHYRGRVLEQVGGEKYLVHFEDGERWTVRRSKMRHVEERVDL